MEKSINLHRCFSMENIFRIFDTSLLAYLSDKCNLRYIVELEFIKRNDITEYYKNIFEEPIDNSKYNDVKLFLLLEKLKEEYNDSFKSIIDSKPINYDECYGC